MSLGKWKQNNAIIQQTHAPGTSVDPSTVHCSLIRKWPQWKGAFKEAMVWWIQIRNSFSYHKPQHVSRRSGMSYYSECLLSSVMVWDLVKINGILYIEKYVFLAWQWSQTHIQCSKNIQVANIKRKALNVLQKAWRNDKKACLRVQTVLKNKTDHTKYWLSSFCCWCHRLDTLQITFFCVVYITLGVGSVSEPPEWTVHVSLTDWLVQIIVGLQVWIYRCSFHLTVELQTRYFHECLQVSLKHCS